VPSNLSGGAFIWGTLAVCIAAGGNFGVQLVGVLAVGAFAFVVSWLVWLALGKIMEVRVSQSAEELGIEAFPEFVLMPDQDDVDQIRNNSTGQKPVHTI